MSFGSVTALGGIARVSASDAGFAMARGGVEVDLDLTVLGQIAIFVILMLVLKPVLFDPMLRLFEEREKRIAGAKLEARKMDEASAGALSKYEAAMAKARGEANRERDGLRAEGMKAETDLMSRVRSETAKTVEDGRAHLAAEKNKVQADMQREATALARELASVALGREVRG
jgi:F-type H+-transporting ATPase subunit b